MSDIGSDLSLSFSNILERDKCYSKYDKMLTWRIWVKSNKEVFTLAAFLKVAELFQHKILKNNNLRYEKYDKKVS